VVTGGVVVVGMILVLKDDDTLRMKFWILIPLVLE